MNKRYVVTVIEIGEEVRTIGNNWEKIGPDDKYGYTPETQATREYSRKVYDQTVDDLDLSSLVSVVNKIGSL